jgi:hypothetical protein
MSRHTKASSHQCLLHIVVKIPVVILAYLSAHWHWCYPSQGASGTRPERARRAVSLDDPAALSLLFQKPVKDMMKARHSRRSVPMSRSQSALAWGLCGGGGELGVGNKSLSESRRDNGCHPLVHIDLPAVYRTGPAQLHRIGPRGDGQTHPPLRPRPGLAQRVPIDRYGPRG